jgi:hypothetical protein
MIGYLLPSDRGIVVACEHRWNLHGWLEDDAVPSHRLAHCDEDCRYTITEVQPVPDDVLAAYELQRSRRVR